VKLPTAAVGKAPGDGNSQSATGGKGPDEIIVYSCIDDKL